MLLVCSIISLFAEVHRLGLTFFHHFSMLSFNTRSFLSKTAKLFYLFSAILRYDSDIFWLILFSMFLACFSRTLPLVDSCSCYVSTCTVSPFAQDDIKCADPLTCPGGFQPTEAGRYAVDMQFKAWESSIRFIAFLLWNQFSNFEQLWKRRRTGINHLFMWFASALRMSSRFVDVCWSSSMFNQSLRSWTLIVLSRDALTIFDRWKVIAVRYLAEYKDEPLVGDVAVDSCVLFSTCFEFQTTSQNGVEFGVISSTLRPLLRESRH